MFMKLTHHVWESAHHPIRHAVRHKLHHVIDIHHSIHWHVGDHHIRSVEGYTLGALVTL